MKRPKTPSTLESGLVIAALMLATPQAHAAPTSTVLGQTFPIAEPDTLAEIKQAAASRDWKSWMRRKPADYSAFKSAHLPVAKADASRLFDPTYSLPFDIRDDKGKMLFPKGTKVNVYDKLKVPGRYIVIAPQESHYRWLEEVVKPSNQDKILLANGNVLTTRQKTGLNVFQLDDRFIERFGLQAVPAVVQQEGNRLRVKEYALAP